MTQSTIHLFADGAQGGGILSTVLMFGAMFAILYFVMIRPQQKQAKKHQALLNALKKGDDVMLSSGILARVYAIEDKYITLEIGEKVRFKALKQAISSVVSADSSASVENQTKNS